MKVASLAMSMGAVAVGVLLAAGPARADANQEMMEAAGRLVFHRCQTCHSLDTSVNAFGPSLHGVVGRKAGTVPRFEYSDAMRKSGITWTEDKLRQWVADNEKTVPGTRMRHVAITDVAEQDYLIAFLKSLK
ncbi:c-type cytochrome [Azospirillum sp.]|uniref:c-type cytochrome n=1 Tax=Azospirillum sp. TaxID=34012 RepID=UPI002D57412F|nr:c-type cytochrome [Azospirillum sp.]HYD68431.1 c-type cytochrome [Azospirillum sp.]